MAVLGGAGRVYGAILGAAGITVLRDQLQNLLPWLFGHTGNFEAIAYGAVLVLVWLPLVPAAPMAASGFWIGLVLGLTIAAVLLTGFLNRLSLQRLHTSIS